MAAELILDTGALVSLLDRRQPQHHDCFQIFEIWEVSIVTTEAVLTTDRRAFTVYRTEKGTPFHILPEARP